jgi:hypothetical protein
MNKKIFSIFVFLFLLVLLPIVNAQALGFVNTRIEFILVNTIVIALILFIIQAILLNKMPAEQKGIIWVLILLISVVIAYFNRTRFIWQIIDPDGKFLTLRVIVNAVILAAFFYFLLQFAGEGLKSGAGKTGAIILILIFSTIISAKVTFDDAGNERFIWQTDTIKEFGTYLFGPEGILTMNDNRFFVFISASLLFSWLFTMFITPEGGVGSKLNYALAILISANMASGPDPVSGTTLIWIGEVITGIAIFRGLQKSVGAERTGLAMVLAAGLTHYVAYIAFGERAIFGGFPVNVLTGNFGFLGALGWFGGGIILLGILFTFMAKGESEFKKRLKEGGGRVMNIAFTGALRKLNQIQSLWHFRNRLPLIHLFRENVYLFQILTNYAKRAEITHTYWKDVKDKKQFSGEILDTLKKYEDLDILEHELRIYRSGVTEGDGDDLRITFHGWNISNLELVRALNRFSLTVAKFRRDAQFGLRDPNGLRVYLTSMETQVTEMTTISEELEEKYKDYIERLEAYGSHHALRSYRIHTFDIDNVQWGGGYEHHHRFAKPNAVFRNPETGAETRARSRRDGDKVFPLDEVTVRGDLVTNLHDIKEADRFMRLLKDNYDVNKPKRLVDPKKIIPYTLLNDNIQWLDFDWRNFLDDLKFGKSHPFSRTAGDYISAFSQNITNDDNINPSTSPTDQNPAFDMRALSDPGIVLYWGRKKLERDNVLMNNPLPAISTQGIQRYLIHKIDLDIAGTEVAQDLKRRLVAETGETERSKQRPVGATLADV